MHHVWIIMSAVTAGIAASFSVLFFRVWWRTNNMKALFLSLAFVGPVARNATEAYVVATHSTADMLVPISSVRFIGLAGLSVCLLIGGFGVFFLNGAHE
jgi:hypothetical protein